MEKCPKKGLAMAEGVWIRNHGTVSYLDEVFRSIKDRRTTDKEITFSLSVTFSFGCSYSLL
jgi:hypothetical protein